MRILLGFAILVMLTFATYSYGEKLETLPFFWQAFVSIFFAALSLFAGWLFIVAAHSAKK